MGIGRRLLLCLVEQAQKAGLANIFLEVRVSNETARGLYVQTGFEAVGLRKNFYSKPAEDGILMVKNLQ